MEEGTELKNPVKGTESPKGIFFSPLMVIDANACEVQNMNVSRWIVCATGASTVPQTDRNRFTSIYNLWKKRTFIFRIMQQNLDLLNIAGIVSKTDF